MAAGVAVAAVLAAATMGTALATSAEDDLAVVKRAVQEPSARVEPADVPEVRAAAPRAPVSARDLRWFKVRITEKGAKKAKVTVNLPIALVRALGDDFPIDIGRDRERDRWRGSRRETVLRLGDVLSALEAGQSLVEIDDDDATVRVWVE
ncbi:MAG TPA: hypothetical protein VML54_12520 [Candidatus Limnocylindrales bacterium]|nr:hypothetical protein [Candidatus Limnocylindrales bacterium]